MSVVRFRPEPPFSERFLEQTDPGLVLIDFPAVPETSFHQCTDCCSDFFFATHEPMLCKGLAGIAPKSRTATDGNEANFPLLG